ncbi:unnamed protein product [Absidia cylindrospora]
MLLSPFRSALNTTSYLPVRLLTTKNTHCCYRLRSSLQGFSTTAIGSQRHYTNQPDEYELRVGYAITVLQDELPRFFDQGLQVHDIYSQHVVLSDPHYTRLSIKGRTAYLGIAEMLRWSLGCYFDKADFEIIRMRVLPDKPSHGDDMTSPPPPPPPSSLSSSSSLYPTSSYVLSPPVSKQTFPLIKPSPNLDDLHHQQQHRLFATTTSAMPLLEDMKYNHSSSFSTTFSKDRPSSNIRSLEIRWQLQARPRSFYHSSSQQSNNNKTRQVDGVFIYTFDQQGYICEHKIQRIEPSPSKTILLMHSYGGRLRAFLEALKRRSEPELRPGLGC